MLVVNFCLLRLVDYIHYYLQQLVAATNSRKNYPRRRTTGTRPWFSGIVLPYRAGSRRPDATQPTGLVGCFCSLVGVVEACITSSSLGGLAGGIDPRPRLPFALLLQQRASVSARSSLVFLACAVVRRRSTHRCWDRVFHPPRGCLVALVPESLAVSLFACGLLFASSAPGHRTHRNATRIVRHRKRIQEERRSHLCCLASF